MSTYFAIQENKINLSLKKLREKIIEIGMLVNIINPYHDGFEINKKTASFAFVMHKISKHIIGQLTALIFDTSRNYQVASLKQVNNDIIKYSKNNDVKGGRFRDQFGSVPRKINSINQKYYEKLKPFRDKSYAHHAITNIEKDRTDLHLDWNDVNKLIQKSKEILSILLLYWDDSGSDFAENQYKDYQKSFGK